MGFLCSGELRIKHPPNKNNEFEQVPYTMTERVRYNMNIKIIRYNIIILYIII